MPNNFISEKNVQSFLSPLSFSRCGLEKSDWRFSMKPFSALFFVSFYAVWRKNSGRWNIGVFLGKGQYQVSVNKFSVNKSECEQKWTKVIQAEHLWCLYAKVIGNIYDYYLVSSTALERELDLFSLLATSKDFASTVKYETLLRSKLVASFQDVYVKDFWQKHKKLKRSLLSESELFPKN